MRSRTSQAQHPLGGRLCRMLGTQAQTRGQIAIDPRAHAEPSTDGGGPTRVAVVSFEGEGMPTPRGRRVEAMASELRHTYRVDIVSAAPSPRPGSVPARRPSLRRLRRMAARVVAWFLLDKYEPWALTHLLRWQPDVEFAVLVASPYSPALYASRALRRLGVPYVVDVGDPWVVTRISGASARLPRGPAYVRALVSERRMWEGACGGVVTSERMAADLRTSFPSLPVLVRPNGYETVRRAARPAVAGVIGGRNPGALHLAHFGSIYGMRVPIDGFLALLQSSGEWNRVEFHQYGDVWDDAGLRLAHARASGVAISFHTQVDWSEAVARVAEYDAVVAIGNVSGLGPPSKVLQYLTLPVPRIALIGDPGRDETAAFVRDLSGWLVVAATDSSAPARVRAHVGGSWSETELAPPREHAWDRVAAEIVRFTVNATRSPRHSAGAPASSRRGGVES